MLFYYLFLAAFTVLMLYVFYQHISSLHWEESEVRQLENLELNVAGILRLLDAPDVRLLLEDASARQNLFMEFSSALRRDVATFRRWGRIRPESWAIMALFFVSYYFMRVKASLMCGRRDLHFLSGLELALVRSIRG
ncbi:MAG: hypothetical protein EHM61_03170 [Acidobacteria bacterium]|nr:MAG: hypothetical protein EHM61_03170 [Acidobacteriota bacterium]